MTSVHERLASSRDYEREAQHTRRRLADQLDELNDRLTPGQVFDEIVTYSKGSGGTVLRAFSNAMRENPIPGLLVSAGCMMFLAEKMGFSAFDDRAASSDPHWVSRMGEAQGSRSATFTARSAAASAAASVQSGIARASGVANAQASNAAGVAGRAAAAIGDKVSAAADAASAQASNFADAVRQGAAAMADKVSEAADATRIMAHDWRDQTSDALGQAGQNPGDAIAAARGYSSSVGERVVGAANRTRRQATNSAIQTREAARTFISNQPLLSAALGIAVGAAIASLLPRTTQEDQLMGGTSDTVKGAASQIASEQLDAVKESAARVVRKARHVAEEEGLTPAAGSDAAHDLADRIRRGSSESDAAEQTGLENPS
jgi:ElaB/YqjD/DUF883 family membrane-anchored ribosome-binding protein